MKVLESCPFPDWQHPAIATTENTGSLEKPVSQHRLDDTHPDSNPAAKIAPSGVTLIPRPSDDPKDPLVCLPVIQLAHPLNTIQEFAQFEKSYHHS